MTFHDFVYMAVTTFHRPESPVERVTLHPSKCYEPNWKETVFHDLLVYTDESLGDMEMLLYAKGRTAKASVQGGQFVMRTLDD